MARRATDEPVCVAIKYACMLSGQYSYVFGVLASVLQ
jgi:hypothetical protein